MNNTDILVLVNDINIELDESFDELDSSSFDNYDTGFSEGYDVGYMSGLISIRNQLTEMLENNGII